LSYDSKYFPNDKYQGLPIKGYTDMINNMIKHKNIELITNIKNDFLYKNNNFYIKKQVINGPIIYTGHLDKLFNFKYGKLPYRSLHIAFKTYNQKSYQQKAVENYPQHSTMTRITEYKKFTNQKSNKTTISKEYPGEYIPNAKK
jgi:UDP-galactopyranose mutase